MTLGRRRWSCEALRMVTQQMPAILQGLFASAFSLYCCCAGAQATLGGNPCALLLRRVVRRSHVAPSFHSVSSLSRLARAVCPVSSASVRGATGDVSALLRDRAARRRGMAFGYSAGTA